MKTAALLLLLLTAWPAGAAQKIITFSDGVGPEAQARLAGTRGGRIVKYFPFINGALADFPDNVRTADLKRAPGVASAEDDLELYWLGSEEPPLSLEAAQALARSLLAGEPAPAQPPAVSTPPAPIAPPYVSTANAQGQIDRLPWSASRLQVTRAWSLTKGKGARVAVIDSGVDCSHPDLAPNCLPGYNALAPGELPQDEKGHGTHVAGIIAGALNWSGMAGMAPEASILPVKVLNSSGSGKVSQIIDGLQWAVARKPDIINMSLGGPNHSEAQGKAVKAARKAGILVVCAAGNDGGTVNYPAAFEDAVAVTAMDFSNKLTDFSCRGPETDFIAPGVKIFSASPGGKFTLASGTSQAAPHISGLAALAASLGVKGEAALRAALEKAAYNLGLPREQQGAGVPLAAYLVNNILSGK